MPNRTDAWALHVAHVHAACRFLKACTTEGIPALPVKGIVAAVTLYDDPTKRVVTDVDVRIRGRDFERVGDLAKRNGWRILEEKHTYKNYVLRVEGVDVDIECAIGPPHVSTLRVEDMLASAKSSSLLGFETLMPNFVDHTVLQMINVFKDKIVLARDMAIEDLHRIAGHAAFDASRIAARHRENKTTTLAWIVSDYAVTELGITRWGAVRDALEPIARPVYARAMKLARRRPHSRVAVLLARAASDNRIECARAVAAMVRWAIEARLAR